MDNTIGRDMLIKSGKNVPCLHLVCFHNTLHSSKKSHVFLFILKQKKPHGFVHDLFF